MRSVGKVDGDHQLLQGKQVSRNPRFGRAAGGRRGGDRYCSVSDVRLLITRPGQGLGVRTEPAAHTHDGITVRVRGLSSLSAHFQYTLVCNQHVQTSRRLRLRDNGHQYK